MGYDFSIGGRVHEQPSDGGSFLTFTDVEERLVEAWGFLRRLPDRERGWQTIRANWPDTLRHTWFGDYPSSDAESAPCAPGLRTAEVARMEEALAWVAWVPERDRRLLGLVLSALDRGEAQAPWIDLAHVIGAGATPDALRMRYGRAVSRIAAMLAKGRKPPAFG
jgi:hypothetical protein